MRNMLVAGCVCLLGCALGPVVIDGKPVARVNHVFVGQPFHVTHKEAHPRPGGPSAGTQGAGGDISGNVCGMSVNLSVEHRRDHVVISGFLDGQAPMDVTIREVNGYHRIKGGMGYHNVDLSLFGNRLIGWIGHCKVDMSTGPDPQANHLVQMVNIQGTPRALILSGVNALWAMPAADQAATLPLLLQCQLSQMWNHFGADPPAIGFGGKESAVPIGTMSLSSRNSFCR